MRIRSTRFIVALLLGTLVPLAQARDKDRAWKTGMLLDSSTQTGSRVVGDEDRVVTLRNDLTYYRIDAGDIVYVVARTLRSRRDKALDVTINRPVHYVIDGSNCYLRDDEGKEHKLTIEKKIAR